MFNFIQKLFLIIILPITFIDLSGQSYPVINYTEEDGLPSSTVYDIKQDSLGRMWFATRNGICRYDGYDWKIFNTQTGLPVNDFIKIKFDRSGNLWALNVSPNNYLYMFNGKEWKDYSPNSGQFVSVIPTSFDINLSVDTTIVVSTHKTGILIYKNGVWKQLTSADGLASNSVNDVLFSNNSLYVSTKNGITLIKEETSKTLLSNKNVLTVKRNNIDLQDNRIWVLSSNELGYFENDAYVKLTSDFKFRKNVKLSAGVLVHSLCGKIIFGTNYTIYIYDKESNNVDYFGTPQGLISEGAYSVFSDREGILWFSGYRGVSKLISMRLRSYSGFNGLYKSEVTSIVERNKGEYIFGHFNGLTIFDGNNFNHLKFSAEPKNAPTRNRVHDMAVDRDKNIWIAAEKSGFGMLNKNNKLTWFKDKENSSFNGYSITVNNNNEVYAVNQKQILKFDGKKFEDTETPDKYLSVFKRKLFFDSEDNLYIASSKAGVIVKNKNDQYKNYISPSNHKANNVYAVFPIDSNNVFVGTLAGLYITEGDTLKKFVSGNFQINRPVYFIVKDSSNSFWFGTDNGVTKWGSDKTFSLGYLEGLAGLETNRDAGIADKEGNILIGTNNGVSIYTAAYDKVNLSKPILLFSYLSSADGEFEFNNPIQFDYENNDVTFHFNGISFLNEKENSYKVKLEGFDSDWLKEFKSNDPQIRYTNLLPGKYQFHVKVKNAAGLWSREFVSPPLIIEKPFFNELWFIIILVLAALLLLYIIISYFQKIIYSKRLKQEVVKRTAELYETQKRYKSMFEENSAIMLLIDCESLQIIDANPSALKFYGYNNEEIVTLNYLDLESSSDKEDINELLTKTEQYYNSKHKTMINGIRHVEVYPSKFYVNEKLAVYIIINDITERVLAENIVQESEEKFRGLVENIQDGIVLIQHGKIQYCNAAFASMLGYNVEEIKNKDFIELVAHESKSFIKEQYAKRQRKETAVNEYEAVLIHKNKIEKVYVNVHAGLTILNDEIATIGTIKNITERKRNLEQLTKLSTAVEQSPVCIFITDTEARIEYVNPKFSELYNYEAGEVLGEYVRILKSGKDVGQDYNQLWETIKSGNTWRGELLNQSKSGKEVWVATSIAPVVHTGGIISHYIAIQDDITFDKYARQAIVENENLLNTVLSKIPLFIFMLDSEGIIKVAKGTVLGELGIDEEILLGNKVSKLKESYKKIEEDVKRAIKGETFTAERMLKNVVAEVTYTPILSDSSELVGTIGIAYDITERFKFEEELKIAKHEAEKSNNLKSEFLAQMSHEIRTPINSILSFSTLIKDHLEGALSEDLAQSFNFIEAGGRRLIRTIDMILNMSQFQTGTYQPNLDKLDLETQVIQSVLNELSPLAAQKGLNINYSNSAAHSNIKGDLYTVSQIFVNLIENAIKYSFEGAININMFDEDSEYLIVDIADQGIGMSDDFQKLIFTPFMQEERGYSRKYEGNGLGLALVKKYIAVNDASISVKSEKGAGSTFSLKFKKYPT